MPDGPGDLDIWRVIGISYRSSGHTGVRRLERGGLDSSVVREETGRSLRRLMGPPIPFFVQDR